MRQYTAPQHVEISPESSCADIVWENAEHYPDEPVLARELDGSNTLTSAEFASAVGGVAKGLIASGIGPGDRVGLMSRTRFEWTLFDMAILATGAVVVPLYETSSADQVQWMLSNSDAKACIVESAEHEAIVASVRDSLPLLAHVWQIDADASAEETLTARGAGISDETLHTRRAALKASDTATIIYTSGTTGTPKGCVLTHDNLLYGPRNALACFTELINPASRILLFLPLAHVLAREIQMCVLAARSTLAFCPDPKNDLLDSVATFQPTFMLAVPRVLEKIYNGAKHKAHSTGKGRIFDAAEKTATDYSISLDAGGPGLFLRLKHAIFERLVYSKIKAVLGGDVVGAISGGAPLGARLAHFFRGVGVNVYEGYGLTETTAATTVNRPGEVSIGSVGRPIPGTTVAIADDGEVVISGRHVIPEYWKNAEATDESFDDEWFHTGDLGNLNEDGYLTITGRKKEILVTAGGKNVAPATLEDRLRSHRLVSQCMIVGDGQPFIACLVTLDEEVLESWKQEHNKLPSLTLAQLRNDPDLHAAVQEAVNDANKAVSHAEAIKVFRILDTDFTIENDLLTPSWKVKRDRVAAQFADEINAIYSG